MLRLSLKAKRMRTLNEHTKFSNELLLFLGVCGMWVNDIKCL